MIQVLLSAILLPRTLEAALGAPFSDDYNTLDALDDLRPPPVIPIPTRPLQWGEANFLSTSDTHGWLLGHQHNTWPEPNYSGAYGSWASFATHMRAEANARGVDLLLVDAGDHHDGSGLVSTSQYSAEASDDIFSMLEYDVLTLGNHELYKYPSARWIYDNRKRWNGRYLTSNVNITVEKDGRAVSVPIADRYAKFETKFGRRVTAFGVLFNFKAHDRNLTIQSPAKMSREQWFIDAIDEAPDYFVLVGHMPGRGETSEWLPVYEAIRRIHPLVPIYIFGGHTHVRDCVQYDGRSIALVPGRYLETIAFTSSSLPPLNDDGKPLEINRRYLDANPVTYKWHANKTDEDFDTPLGLNITSALGQLARELRIDTPFGTAPHDLFLTRHPYGHPRSVLTVFAEKVLPAVVRDEYRDGPRVIIGNAGSLRFDVFKGDFDRNDELTVSPFTTAFLYTRLPARLADRIAIEMNRAGPSKIAALSPQEEEEAHVREVYEEWLASQWEDHVASRLLDGTDEVVFSNKKPQTLGYVTRDACHGKGDDIEHIPVPFSRDQVPFIITPLPQVPYDEIIDVVVMDFAMDDFLAAANTLAPKRNIKLEDFKPYAEGLLINEVFGLYAKLAW